MSRSNKKYWFSVHSIIILSFKDAELAIDGKGAFILCNGMSVFRLPCVDCIRYPQLDAPN